MANPIVTIRVRRPPAFGEPHETLKPTSRPGQTRKAAHAQGPYRPRGGATCMTRRDSIVPPALRFGRGELDCYDPASPTPSIRQTSRDPEAYITPQANKKSPLDTGPYRPCGGATCMTRRDSIVPPALRFGRGELGSSDPMEVASRSAPKTPSRLSGFFSAVWHRSGPLPGPDDVSPDGPLEGSQALADSIDALLGVLSWLRAQPVAG